MTQDQIMTIAEQAANEMLLWVGFGTLVGLAAKAVMPGRDPGGAVSTMIMGIGGSVIGCGVLAFFWEGLVISPVSIVGSVVSTAGAFTLLFFYKLLSGSFFAEAEDGDYFLHRYRRNRRRRRMVRGT
ncbi:GlsB/YeaQ/YmgE family stress response membrane protein [Rubinisphaera margarita]|uniref:GlsB/YeaQ/YmgE family stress response membrane protein n=1 Tax=Rubinisphaera margarita TaxID=2909586 RepID=UPI001EE93A86|nr:GlsB/YeaQ/YmgE family stress response membrane protein [Rubinisphaera margarita]MCG6156091.1 GlsB/YeaQ/YmgE family stress response membrane protein [Rubinisphaera margarita]